MPAEGGVGCSSSTSEDAGNGRTGEGGSGGELVNVTLIVGIEVHGKKNRLRSTAAYKGLWVCVGCFFS